MKKSTIVVLIGGFVLLTALLGPVSHEKMYKKQKNFTSSEEIVEILNSKPLLQFKEGRGYRIKETDELSECLSVRKRVTGSDFDFAKLDVNEVVELDEKTENSLLDYYNKLRENYTKRLPISAEKAVRLKMKSYYISHYRTGELQPDGNREYDQYLDLVLVDEGEGYVIDFINSFYEDYVPDYSKIDAYDGVYYNNGGYNKESEKSQSEPTEPVETESESTLEDDINA